MRKRVKKQRMYNEERGSTRAKIYYDARGREITVEEKRGKRESRWTKGKGRTDSDGASARKGDGKRERAAAVGRARDGWVGRMRKIERDGRENEFSLAVR